MKVYSERLQLRLWVLSVLLRLFRETMMSSEQVYAVGVLKRFVKEYAQKPKEMDPALFQDALLNNGIQVIFHGPCGSGKTTIVRAMNNIKDFLGTEHVNRETKVTQFNEILDCVQKLKNGTMKKCEELMCDLATCTHHLMFLQRVLLNNFISGKVEGLDAPVMETDWLDVIVYTKIWGEMCHKYEIKGLEHHVQRYLERFNKPNILHIFIVPTVEEILENIRNRGRPCEEVYDRSILERVIIWFEKITDGLVFDNEFFVSLSYKNV